MGIIAKPILQRVGIAAPSNKEPEKAPTSLQGYLQRIIQLDNVPRKEKQFRNLCQTYEKNKTKKSDR